MKKLLILLAACALASFALAACGSDDNSDSSSTVAESPDSTAAESTDSGSGGGATVDVTADPSGKLAWTETEVDAKAGPSTIELVNDSPTPHDLVVEDADGKQLGEAEDVANGTTSFDTDLQPGTYTYYCSIPGHREAGMEGTLTVK